MYSSVKEFNSAAFKKLSHAHSSHIETFQKYIWTSPDVMKL